MVMFAGMDFADFTVGSKVLQKS